jgi:hypothetical protein
MSRRMRAAIEAMPHEHPQLGAVAIDSVSGQDFAAMLERAIERSAGVGAKVSEHRPEEAPPPHRPTPAQVSDAAQHRPFPTLRRR